MAFKEINDLDSNGLNDAGQSKLNPHLDQAESDKTTELLGKEKPDEANGPERPEVKGVKADDLPPSLLDEAKTGITSDKPKEESADETARKELAGMDPGQQTNRSPSGEVSETPPTSPERKQPENEPTTKEAVATDAAGASDQARLRETEPDRPSPDNAGNKAAEPEQVPYEQPYGSASSTKMEASGEINSALGQFEQSRWSELNLEGKKEAISSLCDGLSKDLDIQDKPEVRYYANDSSEFGGYSRQENAVYINENNLENGRDTADTVAHEVRHCWQHERAENPQTEQDFRLKDNFDDYIRPEDDFYEYQKQPVEADARDYAQNVRDMIPSPNENSSKEGKPNHAESIHEKNDGAPPSTTGPPEKTYQKNELPADFENKNSYQPLTEQAELKCQLAGLEKDQIQKIREIPNGQKPNPEDYLSKDFINRHIKNFNDEGCYKVIPNEPAGTIGKGDSLFVCRGSEFEQALVESDGDPRKLEKALGMDDGYLGDNPYVVRIDNPKNLRMATGNETNAWQDYWCPGGTTIGGMDEAVVAPPSPVDYSFKPCFEKGNSTSIYDENWKKTLKG